MNNMNRTSDCHSRTRRSNSSSSLSSEGREKRGKDKCHGRIARSSSSSSTDYDRKAKKRRKDRKTRNRSVDSSSSSGGKRSSRKQKSTKRKKKNKRSRSSSAEWVEKTNPTSLRKPICDEDGRHLTGSDWLTDGILSACSERPKPVKTPKNANTCITVAPGQSDRELNPYWKNGGTGLPTARDHQPSEYSPALGDKGVEWYERALRRVKEVAEEEGRSMEDVAKERWGSLHELESRIRQAKERSRSEYDQKRSTESSRSLREDREGSRPSFRRPGDEFRSERASDRTSSSRTNEKNSSYREEDRDNRRSMFRRPGDEYHRERTNERNSANRTSKWRKGVKESTAIPLETVKSTPEDKETLKSVAKPCVNEVEEVLTDEQLNALAAKLVKAEIMGKSDLVEKLKTKLENARKLREVAKAGPKEETIILTVTNDKGLTRPMSGPSRREPIGGRRKDKRVETHEAGQRQRYFFDDDKHNLKDMFEKEKLSTGDDDKSLFLKMAAKRGKNADSDEETGAFEDAMRIKQSDGKAQEKERDRAIHEANRHRKALEGCRWCLDNPQRSKHLIVSIGETCYLCLPEEEPLTPMYCLIVPIQHVACGTIADEDIWEEAHKYMKAVMDMAEQNGNDVVFFEQVRGLRNSPHMVIHCAVIDRESGADAPIYFKKAILESESEWASNKKLVDIKGTDVRRSVPKGLPYFSVQFGISGGFAHVIEDERLFPSHFAQEIIGGMLDLDHSKWRKPRKLNVNVQRQNTVAFTSKWKPFDSITKRTRRKSSSSSSTSSTSDSE